MATAVANQGKAFSITDTKLYVPGITLSTQDNEKLLKKLKSGLKRTIKWNKYQSKVLTERASQYLDDLIDPSFQGVNSLFVLPLEDNAYRTSCNRYFLPTSKIKDYNVIIPEKNLF